jgi:hypothetical protein
MGQHAELRLLNADLDESAKRQALAYSILSSDEAGPDAGQTV